MYRWRQYTVFLHSQNTRHYTPSSPCLASKPLKRSKDVSLPTRFPKYRPHAPRVSRAPQTNDPHQRPLTKSKWYEWVKNHKIIFCGFCMFGYMMFEFSWTLQRVPITERRRLDYVPSWLEHFFNYVEHTMKEEVDNQNSLGRESPIMQGPASTFNNLLRVSGLDDREWELRVVVAPGE